jgi:hypothetical protein
MLDCSGCGSQFIANFFGLRNGSPCPFCGQTLSASGWAKVEKERVGLVDEVEIKAWAMIGESMLGGDDK